MGRIGRVRMYPLKLTSDEILRQLKLDKVELPDPILCWYANTLSSRAKKFEGTLKYIFVCDSLEEIETLRTFKIFQSIYNVCFEKKYYVFENLSFKNEEEDIYVIKGSV
jgi:hypothetical protein